MIIYKNKRSNKNQRGSLYLVIMSAAALLLSILLGVLFFKEYQQKDIAESSENTARGNELVIKELNTKLDLSDAPYKDLSYAMVGFDSKNTEKYSALVYSESLMSQALQEANANGAAYTKEDFLVYVEHECNMWASIEYYGDDGYGDRLNPASASPDQLGVGYRIRQCHGTSSKVSDECEKLAKWVTKEVRN